jgi:hypothetical protein
MVDFRGVVMIGLKNLAGIGIVVVCIAGPIAAFELDLQGSIAAGKHERYVAPLSNPLFNETPQITTEARAIYLHNRLQGRGDGMVNLFVSGSRAWENAGFAGQCRGEPGARRRP